MGKFSSFMGSAPFREVLVATCSTVGAAALQSGSAGEWREAPGSLAQRQQGGLVSFLGWFLAPCKHAAGALPAAGSSVRGCRGNAPFWLMQQCGARLRGTLEGESNLLLLALWPKVPTLLVGFVLSPSPAAPSPAAPGPAHQSLAQSSLAPQPGCGALCAFRRMERSVALPTTSTFSQVPLGTSLLLSPASFILWKISLTALPALWLFQSGRSLLPPAEHGIQQPA